MAIASLYALRTPLSSQSKRSHARSEDPALQRPWWKIALFFSPVSAVFILSWELLSLRPVAWLR